jgi:pilus assembly protein FimV
MVKRSIRISSLLSALLFLSCEALGAGLGKMSVTSALGQPLRAEIELLSVPVDDLGSVEAKLAGVEAFRQARIERSSALADIQLTVEKRPNGQPVVRVSSTAPVSEPFVDLLIELNWSSGRILREYTVLLDPVREAKPAADEPVRVPVLPTSKVAPTARPGAVEPPPVSKPVAGADKASAQAPAKAEPVAAPAPSTYGPVKAGESLRGIARKVLPPDVTLEMMMASLYQANRKAFAQNNMNLLKKGQVLTVPDRESVMLMVSPHQARQLMAEHAAAWNDMQGRMADKAARSVAEPVPEEPGKGRIVQAKPQEKPAEKAAPKDVLKLSKGEPAKTVDASAQQRAQALEEEVAAKNRALQEAQDRVSQLEKTVQDLQRLMELKAKEAEKKPEPAAAAKPVEPAKPAEVAPPPPVAPEPPKAKPAVKAPVEVPPEEPGFLATLLGNPLYLAGGLSALVLALVWLYMIGKRRRKGLSDFEQSVMTGGDQFKTSIFKTGSDTSAERATGTQSGVATDFSRLGLGSIDTHEVDPIAEAEVYMAYGRDAQAEEILKEALSKDPSRHEIALKLLEIYATRQDMATFETQASELYASLGDPTSLIWQQAAEMGRKLDPANPLYRVFGEAPAVPEAPVAPAASAAFATMAMATAAAAAEPAAPEPEPAPTDLEGLDFDLAASPELAPQPEPAVSPASAEEAIPGFDDIELDFDTGLSAEAPAADAGVEEAVTEYPAFGSTPATSLADLEEIHIALPETPADEAEPAFELPEELATLDLTAEPEKAMEALGELGFADLDLAAGGLAEPVPEETKSPELDFSGIDLDLAELGTASPAAEPAAEPGFEAPPEIDADLLEEVNTKLDLARAYMEMGDKEGAREILDEVVRDGDSNQKQQAEQLIAGL